MDRGRLDEHTKYWIILNDCIAACWEDARGIMKG